jgi:hypothetical protein
VSEDNDTGLSAELLKALHLLTRDGKLNQDARRKLKQIHHLFEILKPHFDELATDEKALKLWDLGAGKSYLGFLFLELLKHPENVSCEAVESRPELVTTVTELAKKLGLSSKISINQSRIIDLIGGLKAPSNSASETKQAVLALHACDMATDDALAFAISREAELVALVPCCQAELAQRLPELSDAGPARELWAHPWHAREFGSHLTNVFRALVLEAAGYKVRVTQFTGWEHSLKNELILGRKIQHSNPMALKKLTSLVALWPVLPRTLQPIYDAWHRP